MGLDFDDLVPPPPKPILSETEERKEDSWPQPLQELAVPGVEEKCWLESVGNREVRYCGATNHPDLDDTFQCEDSQEIPILYKSSVPLDSDPQIRPEDKSWDTSVFFACRSEEDLLPPGQWHFLWRERFETLEDAKRTLPTYELSADYAELDDSVRKAQNLAIGLGIEPLSLRAADLPAHVQQYSVAFYYDTEGKMLYKIGTSPSALADTISRVVDGISSSRSTEQP